MDKRPEIIHAGEPFMIKGGSIGCLLIHGYTGTPFEMRLLARSLAEEGYTILAPRLFGHATSPEDLLRARYWDWIADVEDDLDILKGITEHQVILGLSMGGILALIAAARYQVDGVVSFSTPSNLPQDLRVKFLPWFYWLMPRQSKGKPDWHNPDAAKNHIDYPYFPTRSILELHALVKTMRAELPAVQVPVLFAQSHGDHTIPAESVDYLFEHVSSPDKTRLWVEKSGHVIIREPEREEVFAAAKEFVKKVTSSK